METIEINGKSYLIDTEKAIEQGLLKEKDNKPRSWQEYCNMNPNFGYFAYNQKPSVLGTSYDIFNSEDEAKAFCALGKLIQLRDAWWGKWRPDYTDFSQEKYYICGVNYKKIDTYNGTFVSHTLLFPTREMLDDFLATFRDLIEQAKMFL